MKIVINADYGGFGYKVAEKFESFVYEYEDDRTNSELVQFVETHPEDCGQLVVVEIPDNITDYEIEEYDGFENVVYVVDGKIHTI